MSDDSTILFCELFYEALQLHLFVLFVNQSSATIIYTILAYVQFINMLKRRKVDIPGGIFLFILDMRKRSNNHRFTMQQIIMNFYLNEKRRHMYFSLEMSSRCLMLTYTFTPIDNALTYT
jgi:hypothetical protein